MPNGNDETRRFGPQTERERILLLEREMKGVRNEMNEGTSMMRAIETTQHGQAVMLERINGKASLSIWVMGICATAIIVGLVALVMQPPAEPQPITVELVMPSTE